MVAEIFRFKVWWPFFDSPCTSDNITNYIWQYLTITIKFLLFQNCINNTKCYWNFWTSVGFGSVWPENLSGHCFHRSSFFFSFFFLLPSLLFYQKERCYGSEILNACMSYQKKVIYGKKSVTKPPFILHYAIIQGEMGLFLTFSVFELQRGYLYQNGVEFRQKVIGAG